MGIISFFKKAFSNMKESAKAQHEVDRAAMEHDAHEKRIAEAKAKTEEANARYDAAKKK